MQTSKEKLRQRFEEEYRKLNPGQKEAVDTIEGPVMVIAGPGTGKTQILASRIGKILIETDTKPEQILCLTFTDAGVVAMRKRLLYFIGSDAYQVNIHTFHSFCNMVIQENIRYFNKKELEALSDLERVECLKKLIDGFSKDNPLKRYKGEIYFDLHNLAGLFSAIKREGWQVEWLLKQIDHYIKEIIPVTEGYYLKREKSKGQDALSQKGKDEAEKMEKLKAAVQAFPRYQQILHEANRYDFDDMINWVIRMFDHNPEVLLNYQEQFQYILVDEYQDTSGSQNRIVEQLISYWEEENPAIFVVGDDDQSIYRFQGANLLNMMHLAEKYARDLVRVVLVENYRSVQPILDAARTLIENNTQRLVNRFKDLQKELICSNASLKPLNDQPRIIVHENEFAENAWIVSNIRELLAKGVAPGKIAVIYREHKWGDELIRFLQLQDIPFFVKKSINLLEDIFIRKILNIIRYTVAELDSPGSGDPLLFEILHYDFFRIRPFTIAAMCNEAAGERNVSGFKKSLRAWIADRSNEQNGKLFSGDDQTDQLIKTAKMLENLQAEVFNLTTQHWFEFMLNETGILAHVMQRDERTWQMEKLTCLFDYIKDSTHRNPTLNLKGLMDQIDLMAENKLSLPLVQTTGTETGVNLMTCHGSKGLEFEYVFAPALQNDLWEGKKKQNKGFMLPPNVFEQETKAEVTEELRRLFFVTITRAEKHLIISYPRMRNDGKLLEPSRFIEEIRLPLNLEIEQVSLTQEEKLLYHSLRFGIVRKPVLPQAETDHVKRMLEKFVMNVTALNNYLDCPLKFYYHTLVRVPSAKSEAAEFGTAIHQALSDFLNHMMKHDRIYPGKAFLLQRFHFHLNNSREVFTATSLQRFAEHGETVLSSYYDKYYTAAPVGDFICTEYPLNKVVIDDIPLKGFADKIQFWNNEVVITDFKTGSLSKANGRGEFEKPGSEKKPDGGNYWRQAVFYKLLAERLPGKNWHVRQVQFDFVEPNSRDEFEVLKLSITQEEEELVRAQIRTVWEHIRQHRFYTGCGKPDCEWCNFAKDNKIYASLLEEDPEMQELPTG